MSKTIQNKFNIQSISEIRSVTLWGALVNVLLAVVKIYVGFFSCSQALIADGIHSVSDLITDIAIFFGAKYWSAPPDKAHPYGHGRLEAIINIGIGLLLVSVAIGIVNNSLTSISHKIIDLPDWNVLWVAIISIIFKEILFKWTASKGKMLKSRALVANAWHHRSDALSSIPVACSVIGAHWFPNLLYLDQVAAIMVALMIFKAAWSIVIPSYKEIMDSAEGKELEIRLIALSREFVEINEIHAFRSRRVGSAILVDFHMLVNPTMSVDEAHVLASKFKKIILKKELEIVDVVIHVEPFFKG
jgi:cation diffusion facilitator family transporter